MDSIFQEFEWGPGHVDQRLVKMEMFRSHNSLSSDGLCSDMPRTSDFDLVFSSPELARSLMVDST